MSNDILDVDIKFIHDNAKKALLKKGYFAFTKSIGSRFPEVNRKGKDPKKAVTHFIVRTEHLVSVKQKLTAEYGSNIRFEAGGRIVVLVGHENENRLKFPKTFNELMGYFSSENTYYRGHPDAAWQLYPSVFREDRARRESEFLYKAITYRPGEFSTTQSAFEILVKMQHYEIPTRLIDVSMSPLIALYFAMENQNDVGCLYVFKPDAKIRKKFYSLSVSLISNLAKFGREFTGAKYQWEIAKEFPLFKLRAKAVEKTLSGSFFVDPRRDNPRILMQKGAFIVVGSKSSYNETTRKYTREHYTASIDDIERKALKIFLPKVLKREIREKLKLLGFNHSDIFPDLNRIGKEVIESEPDF